MKSALDKLECLFCRKEFPLDIFLPFCPDCGEPLLVARTSARKSFHWNEKTALETFKDFLPLETINPDLTLGEGDTPLIELVRLREKFRLPLIYAKNESSNPTASFKDRGTAVAVQKAVSLGCKKIGTVSTGNMAGSTAAYAAKAGLKSVIFVKEDTTREKILAAGVYGPVIVKVKGDYGQLFRKSFDIGRANIIYFMNSVDPFRIEGYKLTSYEIFFQLNGGIPDYVIVPVSAGGHLIGLMRGFADLKGLGVAPKLPLFIGVQAKGCSPLPRAFSQRKTNFAIFPNPHTIAHAISNPNPPGGRLVLKMIRENGGRLIAVSDEEILRAQKDLAEDEGLFCDPASATTFAGIRQLDRARMFKADDRIVLILTGSGLKTLEDLAYTRIPYRTITLNQLEKKISNVIS